MTLGFQDVGEGFQDSAGYLLRECHCINDQDQKTS